jgi:DNA-binding MarR family transcriptional regulator
MPKTAMLIELVQELDHYEKTMDQPDQVTMESFLGHMHAKYLQPPLNFRSMGGELEITVQNQGAERETDISVHITLLFRYAKYYTGLALEECDLNSIDEFSFVIVLMTHPSLSKTELIRQNAVEKSTGIEIINRLIKKGWMEQFPGESDKRTQRVRITDIGRKRLYPVLHDVEKVGQVLAGKLTVSERNTLHYLLRKLEMHHHQLRSNYPNATLNELIVATWNPENEEGAAAEAMAPS